MSESTAPVRGSPILEATTYRTRGCGELRPADAGRQVRLAGWVDSRRDHGGLVFIDLRDRSGKVQVVFSPERSAEAHAAAAELRGEYVVQVEGEVVRRSSDTVNPKLPTGEVEVTARSLKILSRAQPLPFPVDGAAEVAEETRLKWRFIDLRRPAMQRALELRHRMLLAVREHLSSRGFWEVETPLLGKSTPEGARDYLVPARLSPGRFYALPQSPQLYKQLLMIAGCDRYFQIAKCLRDEDLRADRQPEFTQIDVEMSFASFEDVVDVAEGFVCAAFRAALGVELPRPFPRMKYADCINLYGNDKPDLRYDLQLVDAADFARAGSFEPFRRALEEGGIVRALRGVGWGGMSRKEMDELTREVQALGAGGLGWMRVKGETLEGGIAKNFPDDARRALRARLSAEEGDVALVIGGPKKSTNDAMAFLRNKLGSARGWKRPGQFAISWVVDFPLFAWNADEGRWESEHHPFTSPNPEDIGRLESDPGSVRSYSYDLVLNGYEIASGSVRIHDPELQTRVFRVLRLTDEEIEEKFGFFRRALSYGAPPHAGIAVGVDRLVAIMLDAPSIRDVIAFPKTQRGQDLMTEAPSEVNPRQLRELGISVVAQGEKPQAGAPGARPDAGR